MIATIDLPLTRALTEGLGVGVPNVAVSHDDISVAVAEKEED